MNITVSWSRRRLAGRLRYLTAAATAVVVAVSLAPATARSAPAPAYMPPDRQKIKPVPVTDVKPVQVKPAAMPEAASKPAPVWPAAGKGVAQLPSATARGAVPAAAGGLPVRVGRPPGVAANEAPGRVDVEVLDRKTTDRAGVRGVLLRVGRADGSAKVVPASISVDYGGFGTAYGGDWASRLRLSTLPECALNTPSSRECVGKLLPSRNDLKAKTVTASVPVGASTLVAVTAAPSGPAGSYAATSLQPSSTWSAGGNSGDFTWSYPMRTPPAPGGPAPALGLAYSAQSVDGRHAASNNQPSWMGEGFETTTGGFIERRYETCMDDMGNGGNNTEKTGDQCWATDNATLSLAGHSGELIYNASEQRWHLRNDDGSRVQRLTGRDNGDDNGEYWIVTTTDGTQYWFGAHKIPGWSSGKSVTNSTWTAPVYGNHSGEPCHKASYKDSSCVQAWRWNLDYVVDVHGNSASYWYATETNKYARNMDKNDVASYVRGGYLDYVAYGTRRDNDVDSIFSASAPAQVDFAVGDRCLSACATHDEAHWPDTPWDQQCTGSTCETYSPTFWSTKRLTSVTTKILSGSSYTDVERWTFTHTFPDPGDGTRAGLWLSKISHQGLVGTTASVPDIEFTPVQKQNRVDITGDFAAAMKWMRIAQIKYETGGTLSVLYSGPDCAVGSRMPSSLASNTLRCYPVIWKPEGYSDYVTDYFHKYVVTTIYEADNTGGVVPNGSPRMVYSYSYLGNPAWHYADDDGLIEKKEKTWSVWRGYERVGVTVGDTGEQSYTETKYFRGMHGDKAASGTRTVTVTGTGVPTANDEDAYAGMTRESTVYNGPGETVVSRTVNEPWQSTPTASRTINGDQVVSRYVNVLATHQRIAQDNGRPERVRSTRNTFDTYGMTVAVDDAGDAAADGDESCTKTTYEPRNTTAWLMAASHRTVSFALPCSATNDPEALTNDDLISDTRVSFDGQSYGTAPTRGLVTTTEAANAWNAGDPTYDRVSRAAYDAHGRTTTSWDALDNPTTTAYTPTVGGLVTQIVVTNALGHTTTTTVNPAWGASTTVVDPNQKRSELTYDGLGRLTAVWLPGRDKATQTANSTFSYLIRNNAPSVIGTSALNAAGNYLTSYTLFDGLLRPRQTQAPSPEGGRLLTDAFYDTAGRKVREHGAYYATGAPSTTLSTAIDRQDVPSQTRTVYDGANRVIASIFQPYTVERWRTTTSYGGDTTYVTPPAGGTATATVKDARGRTVALRQYEAPTPTGAADTTTYSFNRKGQLAKVTDPVGNQWTYAYDVRGRVITTTDPDKGTTTSTYDLASRLTSTTDARNVTLRYTYDALNRRTAIQQIGVGTHARWRYDTVAKGHLSQAIRFIGTANYTRQIYAYDDAYRPINEAIIIPASETGLGGTYAYTRSYKVDGSLGLEDYPVAGGLPDETVFFDYDPTTGLPIKSTTTYNNIYSYVSAATYNALGQLNQLRLHTGWSSHRPIYQYFTHELETQRLIGVRTDREVGSPYTLADNQYTYDPAGNITKIADRATGDNQCFQHDYLGRLTQAWTPTSGDCASQPAKAALGGPAPYWQKWTYDKAGNRLTQTDYGTAAGSTDKTTTYTYPAAGGVRPHALINTSTTGGATGAYTYDNAGNTLTRPTASSGTQTLTWDPEGHLATSTDSTGTTSYIYDADGNRLVQKDPTGKTLFLPGQEVRYSNASGTTNATRYYTFGGAVVASRTPSALTWMSADHQGTSHIAIDAATQQATIRRQKPFGEPRGAAPTSWPNSRGFVGGIVDNTGLIHLGAREYDPTIGKFISVDPIQDLSDPQQWNAYAYANNSPITRSDPTGLKSCSDDHCGPGADFDDLGGDDKYHEVAGDNDGCGGNCGDDDWEEARRAPSGGNKGGGSNGPTQEEIERAKKIKEQSIIDVVIKAGSQILLDLFGITDLMNCIGGDLKACGWTLINALPWTKVLSLGAKAKKIVDAIITTGKRVLKWMKEVKWADDVLKRGDDAAASCLKHSFDPRTPVLMADGSTKPIAEVDVGDRVVATDPVTGKTTVETVTAVHVNRDRDLTDVTVTVTGKRAPAKPQKESHFMGPSMALAGVAAVAALGAGTATVLHTTDHHPFWDETANVWVDAADLEVGHQLRTADGRLATVTEVRSYTGAKTMHDLTVANVHTYYVMAGQTPVLVHNEGGWTIDPAKSTAAMRGGPFGAMYYQQARDSKGNVFWWSPDKAGHGGSAWKVYRETATGLEWYADADANGDFMQNKYKGEKGKFISFKELKTVNVKGLGSALGGC